jgi:hypothetical protein
MKAIARRARTIKQFCVDYGVGRTFTYTQIKAGRLRAVKAGDRTLILHTDSEAWARTLPQLALNEAAASEHLCAIGEAI